MCFKRTRGGVENPQPTPAERARKIDPVARRENPWIAKRGNAEGRGNLANYGRFGFRADWASGLKSRYAGPHFMALSLARGDWPARSGRLEHAAAYAALR